MELTAQDTPITAPTLRRALAAGARRVIAARDGLNRINVFPVADGDTGNNLASTLGSVLNGALSRPSRHAGELLSRVGNDAIDGARGNSGAILAQFFYGLAEHARALPALDARHLAAAVRQGANSARQALAQPVEGTILSVMTAFADELESTTANASSQANARSGFARALVRARSALANTTRQMPLLQRAGVVDAGAQGFVDMLEGISEFVEGGPRGMRLRGNASLAANEAMELLQHEHDIDPQRRWCTECLLVGEGLDRAALRVALEAGGADSIVIAGGATRLRVHAHTGSPQALFDACARQGQVQGMKADDMLRQQHSASLPRKLVIVTDSAADLPEKIGGQFGIGVVPARVDLDGREYLDKVGLSTAEFYRRMAASQQLPRTSQPPSGDFRRQFELALAHHERVLYVGLSRALSGTLQSGEQAAARDEARRVDVFDTINAACGQALLVWRAAELAEQGHTETYIVSELERLRPLTPSARRRRCDRARCRCAGSCRARPPSSGARPDCSCPAAARASPPRRRRHRGGHAPRPPAGCAGNGRPRNAPAPRPDKRPGSIPPTGAGHTAAAPAAVTEASSPPAGGENPAERSTGSQAVWPRPAAGSSERRRAPADPRQRHG